MDKCFVIQPFDNDKFDKRFKDTFEPAIIRAGFEAYRIDKDLSVRNLVEEIEKGISESVICFAEITLNNPNVWYELGYAFASKKDVVMVCSDERQGTFPFDIQHRQLITYETSSTSDFKVLEDKITKKIKAFQHKSITVKSLNTTPVVDTEGLKSHEIALLILVMENQVSKEEVTPVFRLKNEMSNAGYTDIATSVGIRTLTKIGMIETSYQFDEWSNNEDYLVCKLTDIGENWILTNQDQLQFRKSNNKKIIEIDDLPF